VDKLEVLTGLVQTIDKKGGWWWLQGLDLGLGLTV
jgi:hypothetical protein